MPSWSNQAPDGLQWGAMMVSTRRILITGGSRGIGRAIAGAFAAAGDAVLITGRDLQALRQTQAAAPAGSVTAVVADVADRPAFAAAVTPWLDAGGVDVVVANAGLSRQTPAEGDPTADDAWQALLQVNLHGVWTTLRVCRPWLRPGGRIVLMGSDLSRMGAAGFAGYAATKHALVGLMRALVVDLTPRGITVNTVCPGWVDTDMAQESLTEMADELGLGVDELAAAERSAMPLGRFLQPTEIAALVYYLCSPQAAAITGQTLGIDAGTTPFG
jgi:NAD(P)-dependent dehydrogenase (short-subunit alcohol dehydrogenase family)